MIPDLCLGDLMFLRAHFRVAPRAAIYPLTVDTRTRTKRLHDRGVIARAKGRKATWDLTKTGRVILKMAQAMFSEGVRVGMHAKSFSEANAAARREMEQAS